jgi:GT2 family glycosyltransferase
MAAPQPACNRRLIPDVCVSIVNTNNRDMLEGCLRSLFAGARQVTMEVHVVDNMSNDGSAEMVAREFPQAVLHTSDRRRGFSANHNRSLRACTARYYFLLNEDTLVLDGALDQMVRYLDAHPDVGLLGCMVYHDDGRIQRSEFRLPPTVWTEFGRVSLLGAALERLWPWAAERTHIYVPRSDYTQTHEVFSVSGCAMMIRGETLREVGPLDEEYFIFYEEPDYSTRARRIGYKTVHFADAEIVHYGGSTFGSKPKYAGTVYSMNSMYRFQRKHFGVAKAMLLWPVYLAGIGLSTLGLLAAYPFTPKRRADISRRLIERLYLFRWHLTNPPPPILPYAPPTEEVAPFREGEGPAALP